jgi:hypothetical protein
MTVFQLSTMSSHSHSRYTHNMTWTTRHSRMVRISCITLRHLVRQCSRNIGLVSSDCSASWKLSDNRRKIKHEMIGLVGSGGSQRTCRRNPDAGVGANSRLLPLPGQRLQRSGSPFVDTRRLSNHAPAGCNLPANTKQMSTLCIISRRGRFPCAGEAHDEIF